MYYAIRHRRTGNFLPAQGSWGFTRTEPTSAARSPPRLFISKGPAQQALDWWLRGESYEHRTDGDEIMDQSVVIKTLLRPDRKREDMEIVVITLQVETQDEALLRRL